MSKLKTLLLSLIFILFTLPIFNCLSCFADETLTITTYYPSPYGSYKELSSYRMKIGPTYSTTAMTDSDNGKLIVEGNVGIGTTGPGTFLEVYGSSYSQMALNSGAAGGYARTRYKVGARGRPGIPSFSALA